MDKYADYTLEEFIQDDAFIRWAKSDFPSTDFFWQQFIEQHPEKKELIKQAQTRIIHLVQAIQPRPGETDREEIWNAIQQQVDKTQTPVFTLRRYVNWQRWGAAAASIILLLGFTYYLLYYQQTANSYTQAIADSNVPVEEISNTTQQTMPVELPDHSKVLLEKGSRLSYSKDFTGKERRLYLEGGATFDVTKNPSRPFVVFANELITKVLGTRFRIEAFEQDKLVTVSVQSGRVSVSANKPVQNDDPELSEVILLPNQKVRFVRDKASLTRSLVDEPVMIAPKHQLNQFTFQNAPVHEILAALENVYGVDIDFDAHLFANCRLTTVLDEDSLYDRLTILCEAIDATYKVVDMHIEITGKGCEK